MISFYQLTKLGRRRGYIGILLKHEIDDAVRGTFTTLREEDTPVSAEYISELLRFSYADIMSALRKLKRAGLIEEVK